MIETSISIAVTITARYGAVRTQGENDEKILDYQTYYHTITTTLCNYFAFLFFFKQTAVELVNLQKDSLTFLSRVHEFHGQTSNVKTWVTWWGMDLLEKLRRCLGGHGYSHYNAIGPLIGEAAVCTTGGGDNYVLAQQSARYLLSMLKKAQRGDSLPDTVKYLSNKYSDQIVITKPSDILDMDTLINSFAWLSIQMLNNLKRLLNKYEKKYGSSQKSWNYNLQYIVETTKPHYYFTLLNHYKVVILSITDPSLRKVMLNFMFLFGVSHINEMFKEFLTFKYFTAEAMEILAEAELNLSMELRNEVIGVVDAFDYPDWFLRAPIGRYDGNIYEKYLERIKSQPNYVDVQPYWSKIIRPLTSPKL